MIAWFARHGVAANLLMVLILVGGYFSLQNVKIELFPEFSLDTISISVPYPGAAPEEVEQQIIERIEEKIEDLRGIKEVNATASEGFGVVLVEVESGYDARRLLDDIKTRVDSISTFPEDAEKPIIEETLIKRQVINIAVHGDMDERSLKEYAEEIREELILLPRKYAVPEMGLPELVRLAFTGNFQQIVENVFVKPSDISQVEVSGVRDYEIAVEVSEETLREHGLTFQQVVQRVQTGSVDLPGGTLKTPSGEILLRTKGQAYRGDEFEQLVLLTHADGTHLTLGDVASVNDGFTDSALRTTFNGEPGAVLIVYEVGSQNPLDISRKVKQYMVDKQAELPEGVTISTYRDSSFYLWGRLNTMISNGVVGLILVLGVLTLFLRPSLAFWVTMGIPISFLGTVLLMPFIGLSINLISLFGFILVLGIVVDDAIVVGESVFTEFQKSKEPGTEAAIRGTEAVAMPVTYAVITTMVAFTPLLMLPGFQGKFLIAIPLVVIPTLLFSLVESKLILPHHLSYCHVGDKQQRGSLNPVLKFQRYVSDRLERGIDYYYRPVLKLALDYRYITLAVFSTLLIITIALIAGGWIKVVPFPKVPSDYIFAQLSYPEGTPEAVTKRGIQQIERAIEVVSKQSLDAGRPDPFGGVRVSLGTISSGSGPGGIGSSRSSSNIAEIEVELAKDENRPDEDSAVKLAERWRNAIGSVPGSKSLIFRAVATGGQGDPVDIRVSARSLSDLRAISDELKEALSGFDGITDIRDNLADSQQEIQLKVLPKGEMLGVTQASLGSQVRAAFYGAEAQRVQRGRDDVRVMVRYPRQERESVGDLLNMRVRTPSGVELPLEEVAEVQTGLGFATINRVDGRRVANVITDAEKEKIDLNAVKREMEEEIVPAILAKYPGSQADFVGESQEVAEGNAALMSKTLLVLFIMYAILAIPFRSYLQPAIIMFVIPFSLVGAVAGHFLVGWFKGTFPEALPLSRLSLFGLVALMGVVVNDSLVLVDYINQRRQQDGSLLEAVWNAGAARFRPILLTSLTTFAGLAPILLETSLQAQFLIPMAVSLSFGVAYATILTLLLVPAVYLILEDIKQLFAAIFLIKR